MIENEHYHNNQNFDFVGDDKDPSHVELYTATQENNIEEVKKILESRGEVRLNINPSLWVAVSNGYLQISEIFLKYGVEIDYIHPMGATALYMAVQEGYVDIVKLFLEHGANPNIKAINGYTALYESVINNNYNIVKLLLEYGANTECFIKIGVTPLYLAALYGNLQLITLLLDYGASRNTSYDLAHVAALGKNIPAVQLLAEKTSNLHKFNKEGIEEIALIEMVKNEEDIIFENLVWHFAIGFRKFIITDNMSTDRTREQIKKFAQLTENYTKVFIIEDPIVEHIQSRIVTGMYNLVRSIWPEVKWIFPADADEFWSTKIPLNEVIQKIPEDIDVIEVLAQRYEPSSDYYDFSNDTKFYDKIHYRTYEVNHLHKIAVKVQDGITITQGNHYIEIFNNTQKNILSGNYLELKMYEFRIRSVDQVHKKYSSSMQSNLLAKEKGLLSKEISAHWDAYADYINKYGDKAGEVKFNESFVKLDYALDDPLPIDKAVGLLYEIVGIYSYDYANV